ncbi:hypothetical protein D1007_25089 [Hordeum vulgare]|nr:hypothetical protein D1007_25089 [Hordeum vulgare]
MTGNIKKLWSNAINDRETPLNPFSIDHSPLDWIDVPQQHNKYDFHLISILFAYMSHIDCGLFMLTNVNSFHQGVLANYTHEDISDITKTWLYAIATSSLFETDFMELFGYHTWSAAPKTPCTWKVFAVQGEEISSDSDFEKIAGMRKSGKSTGATLVGRDGNNGVIARRNPALESGNITSLKRAARLPLKWRSRFKRFVGLLQEVYRKAEYKARNQPNWLPIAKRPTYVEVPKQGPNECGFFCVKFCFTYDRDGLTEDFGDLDSSAIDDWKVKFMYNLVFSPKNEILREVLPAEIRELVHSSLHFRNIDFV